MTPSCVRPDDLVSASPTKPASGVFCAYRVVAHVWRRGEFDQPLEYATHLEVFPTDGPAHLVSGNYFRFRTTLQRDFERRCRLEGVAGPDPPPKHPGRPPPLGPEPRPLECFGGRGH